MAIIGGVEIHKLHAWRLDITQACGIQRELSKQVSWAGEVIEPDFIAGVDIAIGKKNEKAQAAIVVLNYPELRPVAVELAQGRLGLPYIPGFLSFRESSLII